MAEEITAPEQSVADVQAIQSMPQPPKRKLYDALAGASYYTKSYEDFDKQFSTPEQIKKLYGTLNQSQFYTKGEQDFNNQFFTPEKKSPVGNGSQNGLDLSGSGLNPFQNSQVATNTPIVNPHERAIQTAQQQRQAAHQQQITPPEQPAGDRSIMDNVAQAMYLPAVKQGFNETIIKPLAGATDFVDRTVDKAYKGITGDETPSWMRESKNSLFKTVSNQIQKEYDTRDKPTNIVSDVAEGAIGTLPLIASMYTGAGETGLAAKAPQLFGKLSKVLATTKGLSAYHDATKDGDSYGGSLVKAGNAAVSGGLEGGLMEAQMLIGGAMGKGVVNKLAEKGLLKGGKTAQALIHALSVGATFGGTSAGEDLMSGKDIDTHNVIKQFGTGLAFEAIPTIQALHGDLTNHLEGKKINSDAAQAAVVASSASNINGESAVRTLINTPIETLKQVHTDIPDNHETLYANSIEKGAAAYDAKSVPEKRDLYAQQLALKAQGDIKLIADKVSDPETLQSLKNDIWDNEQLSDEDVKDLYDKLDALANKKAPVVEQPIAETVPAETNQVTPPDIQPIANEPEPIRTETPPIAEAKPEQPISEKADSVAPVEAPVKEVEVKQPAIQPARQKAIDAITHGIIGDGERKAGDASPRFDLGMNTKEQKQAIRDITKGNYESAAAKKMIDKVSEFEAKGEYPIIEGLGGNSVRSRAASAEDIQQHIDAAKQFKLAKEQDIEANNQGLKDLGVTHENIQDYENYRAAGEPGTIPDNGRATENPAKDVQRTENDTPASVPQDTGGKAAQGGDGKNGGEVKAGDPLRHFAQKVREGKINKLGGFKASTGFDGVWDGSLEVVALAAEGGAKIADAIESGLKHVKKSDWYKNLSNKEDFDKQYREHLANEYAEVEKTRPSKNEETGDRPSEANPVVDKGEIKASKSLKDLAIDIPNGGEVKKYLSGETINKHEGDELRNDQSYIHQELTPALEHGVKIIEQAKDEFGKDYVTKTLDFIDENGTIEGKALMYVSLENELAARKLAEPENALAISKLQDLVRSKSQAYLRSNALAINMGRLRKFAEVGYDINRVTDNFFSQKELEGRGKVEKAIQASPDEINKAAEANEKASPSKDIEFEVKKKPREKKFGLNEAQKKERDVLAKEFRSQLNDVTRIATLLVDKKFLRYAKLEMLDMAGDFESFATRMIDNVGEGIKEHLPELYKKIGGEDEVAIKGKEKTDAERLQDAKDNINKRIDGLSDEILNRKRELKERKAPVEADAELKTLQAEEAALRRVRDKELPLDKKSHTDEEKAKIQANRLTDEIEALDKQIRQGEKDAVEAKSDPIQNEKIIKLKAEKEARIKILDAIDPNPKETVKQALIENGYGREVTVTTKDGKEQRTILDWRKLAGDEGSITNIQYRVEAYLKDNGYSDGEISRMQSAFVDEYNNLRASIIEKSLKELENRNTEKDSPDLKTSARRLAELYNYGLFEKNADTYDYLMNNALGLNGLSQEAFFDAKVLAKSLSDLFKSTDANGKIINQSNLKHAESILNKQIEDLLSKVAWKQSTGAYKAINIVKEYVGMAQRSMLVTVSQLLENSTSGFIARAFNKIGYSIENVDTKALVKMRTKLAQNIAKDINFNAALDYGDVNSPFLNKSKTLEWINSANDSKLYHAMTSAYVGRAFLEAADSMHKVALTEKFFSYNLIKILRKKGMDKQAAVNYVSEQLTGQSFDDAMTSSKTIIDKINEDAGKKVIPDTKESITRFANDIVREALIGGNKLTVKEVEASFKAAYKAAGFELGHEANNLTSMMVSNLSAKIQGKAKEAVKEKDWSGATAYTTASIVSSNIMNPFVGGGSNWVFLGIQKTGIPTFSTLYYNMRARRGIDVSSEAGLKTLEKDLTNQLVARNMNIRMVVGAGVSLAAVALAKSTGADKDLNKWLKKNTWAKKYFYKVSPPALSLLLAMENKDVGHYAATLLNVKDNQAFDEGHKFITAINDASKGGNKNTEKATGAFGSLAGSRLSLPIIPWRITRDAQDIVRGLQGLKPIKKDYKPKGFVNGYLNGGMVEYLKGYWNPNKK